MRAIGIDISKYDSYFKPKGNLDFVIQRSGYGVVKDELFDTLNVGVRKVGIKGAYHYFSTAAPWEAQVDKFLEIVDGRGFDFYALDYEKFYNNMNSQMADDAGEWMEEIAKEGKQVVLYTNPSIYDAHLVPHCDWIHDYSLWIAQWPWFPKPQTGTPGMPKQRRSIDWTIWQYSSTGDGLKYGVARAKALDMDVFNGSVMVMRKWLFGVEDEPEAPEPVEQPVVAEVSRDVVLDEVVAAVEALR